MSADRLQCLGFWWHWVRGQSEPWKEWTSGVTAFVARAELPLVGLPVSVSWWGCRYWGYPGGAKEPEDLDIPSFTFLVTVGLHGPGLLHGVRTQRVVCQSSLGWVDSLLPLPSWTPEPHSHSSVWFSSGFVLVRGGSAVGRGQHLCLCRKGGSRPFPLWPFPALHLHQK